MYKLIRRLFSDNLFPAMMLFELGFVFSVRWAQPLSKESIPFGTIIYHETAGLLGLTWPFLTAGLLSYQLSWHYGRMERSIHTVPLGVFLFNIVVTSFCVMLLFVGPVWL
jgi:hypothetical protein